ncbi:MAG: thiamine pyrophosphate-dependent enzyme [Myxococcales bacterium]|jgi:2-oxoisovalerate dehydrogenase E1 component alpha subunit
MQVIRADGSLEPDPDPGLSIERLVAIYKAMVRTRIVDDRLEKLQRQGRIAFHVGSTGEEAAIIGAAAALRTQDWIVPCYREVGALLWRGYPLQRYVDHMYGNAGDPVRGRQMPDHTFSREHRYLAVSAPIGTQIPHAVGLAMAAKKRGLDECVGVFFGDGATSSNDFHAAMNFAGVYQSPVLFLCRNNGYAISLRSENQTAVRALSDKGAAYGIPALRVDGNDVLAVWNAVREGVRRAAQGSGPTFVELLTYRLGGHSTSDDPRVYRADEEVESWKKADPVLRLRRHIEQQEAWSETLDSDWQAACEEEMRQCVRRAEDESPASLRDLFTDVYADQPWHLREQQEQCLTGPRAEDEEVDA